MYSAAGLLNTLAQAGVSEETIAVPNAGSDTDSSQLAEQALDQGILSAYAAAAGASGIYTAGGSSGLSDQVSSNWADILTSNPSYASAVVGSSLKRLKSCQRLSVSISLSLSRSAMPPGGMPR